MTHQKISASGLIVNQGGQILLVRRADDDDFLPGVFELPGGGTDFQEHPVEGLKRELMEECGIDVEIGHPLTAFSFMMNHEGVDKHTVEIIYLCKLLTDQPIRLSHEHSEYMWVNINEVLKVELTDFMKNLVTELKTHPLMLN